MTDWFRTWHGAPTNPKWLGIARRAGVAPGIAVAVFWALLDRASQAEDRGSIAGYDPEGLGYFFGCEPEQVDLIVVALEEKQVIADNRFCGWEKYQPKREDGSSERAKEWRERKRTQANAEKRPDTDTDTDTDTEDTSSLRSEVSTNSLRSLERVSAQTASVEDEKASRAKPKRGTRLPPDWQPSDDDRAHALSLGIPEPSYRKQVESFRDYWTAKAGASAVKLDWPATLRNWMRRHAEEKGFAPLAASGQPPAAPSGTFWPGPGYPTHEEILAKHSKPKVTDDATADGSGRNDGGSILADGDGVHRPLEGRGSELGKGDQAGRSGMASLGELLSLDRLAPRRHADGRGRLGPFDDRPMPMAGMAGR